MKAKKQIGVSPKILADLIVSVAAFALTFAGFNLDPTTSALLSKAAGFIAGVIVGPGKVEVA